MARPSLSVFLNERLVVITPVGFKKVAAEAANNAVSVSPEFLITSGKNGIIVGPIISNEIGICRYCLIARFYSNGFSDDFSDELVVPIDVVRQYGNIVTKNNFNIFKRFSFCARQRAEPLETALPLPECGNNCSGNLGGTQFGWEAAVSENCGLVHSIHQLPGFSNEKSAFLSVGCRTDTFMSSRANNIGMSCHPKPETAKKIAVFESVERYSCHVDAAIRPSQFSHLPDGIWCSELDDVEQRAPNERSLPFEASAPILANNFGSAAGSTIRFAVASAFSELIEKEIVAISWSNKRSVSIRGYCWTRSMVERTLNFVMVGKAFEKNVILCYAIGEWPYVSFGFGVGTSVREAAEKAEREFLITEHLLLKFREIDRDLIGDRLWQFANNAAAASQFFSWVAALTDPAKTPLNANALSSTFWKIDRTTADVAACGVHVFWVIGDKTRSLGSHKQQVPPYLCPRA
ncbi:YcaO-like family protein [Rhizobium leguminosarum]|uniref:YcaO-like family protein n=1 Tax=Rhizobium leguminosarum TaxID=384 RepID=UPI0003A97449|nr:YcaO-like family protein [Rhizobium leguminosarum]